MTAQQEPPLELRAALAFGQPLRDGIELVRGNGKGTIVVLGHDEADDASFTGGDPVRQDLTDEAILRAAEEGATILNVTLAQIVRKNAILNTEPTTPAVGQGSRHITAQQYSTQTGHPVIAVSEQRRTVTLFLGADVYVLRSKAELRTEIDAQMGFLRTLQNGVDSDNPATHSVTVEARAALLLVKGHLVELGASGDVTKKECEAIAAALGIESSSTFSRARPRVATNPALSSHNEFSGIADKVVQIGSLHPHKPPPPQQLPPPIPHFTDREEDLASVVELLTGDDAKPKTGLIVGVAGIGKSAFAVRCGHAVGDRFPDGVLYADLRGFHPVGTPADPIDVLSGFLRDLGVPEAAIPKDLGRMTGYYRSLLHGRRMLIILDNALNSDQVRPLLPGATTCGVLVTSRNTMTSLMVREGMRRWMLTVLPSADAVHLLSRLTGGDAIRESLPELATLCGYHPLALCVAGTQAALRLPGELDDFVADLRRSRLDSLSDPDDQAASVRATFSLSYQALPASTQRTFRLLGLYPGPTISSTAADVLTSDGDGIQRLLDMHMLERAGQRRYRFHDLLRAYAMDCANESEPADQRRVALRRVLDWFQRTADTYDQLLDPWRPRLSPVTDGTTEPVSRAAALEWFDSELPNLAAATHVARTHGEPELAWRLALAPSAYFFSRKPWATWISVQETGLSAARAAGNRHAEAWLCDGLGVACREQGRHGDALRHFDIAQTRFREVADLVGEAETTLHLAQTYRELGELERALRLSNTAHALFLRADAQHGEAKASNLLGGVHLAMGDPAAALTHTEHAVVIFADLDDELSHAWAVNNLAGVLAKLGRRTEAVAAFSTAMAVRERIDRYGLAFTLQGLGDLLYDNEGVLAAAGHWRAAVRIFDEIGDPRAAQLRTKLTAAGQSGPDEPSDQLDEPDGTRPDDRDQLA